MNGNKEKMKGETVNSCITTMSRHNDKPSEFKSGFLFFLNHVVIRLVSACFFFLSFHFFLPCLSV